MPLTLKSRQVVIVTAMAGLSMAVLTLFHLGSVARFGLQENQARGEMLARALFHRAQAVVEEAAFEGGTRAGSRAPYAALAADPGIRSLLESSIAFGRGVTYAAIVDTDGTAVAHSFSALEGEAVPEAGRLSDVVDRSTLGQVRALYSNDTFEVDEPLLLGEVPFGAIRIGLSTVLIRQDVEGAIRPVAITSLVLLVLASVVAMVLAGRVLKPIHVISAGLSRLGRGERGITLDLPPGDDFEHLGQSFEAISEQLTQQDQEPGPHETAAPPTLESVIARLDASKLASFGRMLAGVAHEVKNPLNSMTIHLELLRQKLGGGPSTLVPAGSILGLESSGPASALSAPRTLAAEATHGPAATGGATDVAGARQHLDVIAGEITRLDQAIQEFLRFVRPDELSRQPVLLDDLARDVLALVKPDAEQAGIVTALDCPSSLPPLDADPGLLRQALVNLALNACHAMPAGGRLRIGGKPGPKGQVIVEVEDTGTGIPADQLPHIFDLYYTTKERGSGIGLSMVYRCVLLHGGDIEVESTPEVGTTFRLRLPQA